MANSVISGTPLQESLNAFNRKLYSLEISFDQHFALSRSGKITTDSLNKLQDAFYRDKHDLILQQIQSNPKAVTSAFVARMVLPDQPDLPTLEAICNALGYASNYYSRQLLEVLQPKSNPAPVCWLRHFPSPIIKAGLSPTVLSGENICFLIFGQAGARLAERKMRTW